MTHPILRTALLAATLCAAGAWTANPSPAAVSPLSVSVTCSGTQCTAYAFGGSGTYVDIEWSEGYEMYDNGQMSIVEMKWDCVPGYFHGMLATVTDSNGARANDTGVMYCPQNNPEF